MPPRPHDPFNDAPRRPVSRARHLQESFIDPSNTLRSNSAAPGSTATAPTATSTRRNLFATSLSRRPTATSATAASTSRLKGEVLEDSADVTAQASRTLRQAPRQEILEEEQEEVDEDEDWDLVIRDDKGGFLHEVPPLAEQIVSVEDEHREEDGRLNALAGEFWAAGAGAGGRGSRRLDEDKYERTKADVMARLRESVGDKLADDKWRFEPTDYMESLRVANHGRV